MAIFALILVIINGTLITARYRYYTANVIENPQDRDPIARRVHKL